jgi:DMSO/TMAO reductase YedYZ molybdopterin-dependent catalytic subunit
VLPKGDAYQRLLENGFKDWNLRIHGLVDRPLAWSLEQLRAMPARTQVTMHNCDEGWSAIGQWTGVQLARLLNLAGLKLNARYVVFHCLDTQEADGVPYYESIDLVDAVHPQTILAYGMNGAPLPVGHGAPLRLRVELQIGYKNAKYVDRIEVVDRLTNIGKGRGGWWEDFDRAPWYAGQ